MDRSFFPWNNTRSNNITNKNHNNFGIIGTSHQERRRQRSLTRKTIIARHSCSVFIAILIRIIIVLLSLASHQFPYSSHFMLSEKYFVLAFHTGSGIVAGGSNRIRVKTNIVATFFKTRNKKRWSSSSLSLSSSPRSLSSFSSQPRNQKKKKKRQHSRWTHTSSTKIFVADNLDDKDGNHDNGDDNTIRTTPISENNDNGMDQLLEEILTTSSTATTTTNTAAKKHNNQWRKVDWKDYVGNTAFPSPTTTTQQQQQQKLSSSSPSPIETVLIRNKLVYIKRDDQLRLSGSQISGNKARKMLLLNQLSFDDFPSCIVSHGGPQSNAMLALAAVVHFQNNNHHHDSSSNNSNSGHDSNETNNNSNDNDTDNGDNKYPKKKRFVYYTKKLPRFLRNQPNGNLFRALSLGMELRQLSVDEYKYLFTTTSTSDALSDSPYQPPISLSPPIPGDSLWIPQGGACGLAIPGAQKLANEVVSYWFQKHKNTQKAPPPLTICVPGGTCTTAVLLHRSINELLLLHNDMDIRVVAIPCVGDDSYAKRQMIALNVATRHQPIDDIPTVLSSTPPVAADDSSSSYFGQTTTTTEFCADDKGYYPFGKPDVSILDTYTKLQKEYNLNVDLLYGAPSWSILLRHWRTTTSSSVPNNNRNKNNHCSSWNPKFPLQGREIMYVHTGGLEGINSQLIRYKYNGLVDLDSIQLPGRSTKK